MRPALPKFVLALAALAVTACSSPDFYLLPPPQAPSASLRSPVSTVSVAEISLPSYADSVEIATLTETGTLSLDKKASWADAPRRGLTRHLAAALDARLANARVGTEPWPGFDRPGLTVEVSVDRLVGSPGSAVELSGLYVITIPQSGSVFASERFNIVVNSETEGFAGIATGHARAIERLADQIAARITGTTIQAS